MKMVDVGAKEKTERVAIATARLKMQPATIRRIRRKEVEKGDVLAAAKLAAVMAAKKTPDLIPLCHPISLSSVTVEIGLAGSGRVDIAATVKTVDRTGVEMEALAAVTAAARTIYDMLKSVDRGMVIERVQLDHKSGGRSGSWTRSAR
ncbi:MAG TPA: cyclic pyranopterin monophosphate synthase MoaC [Myxococcales bacterium]|nr:cyclic pyranopterin monophosphate synthase MoaC [Myxococcales bacterium]